MLRYISFLSFLHHFINLVVAATQSGELITADKFIEYFSNLSAYYDRDEDFISMICSAFSVDPSLRPPPPDYPVGKGAARDATPRGKKVHGDYITWNQEPSTLEDAELAQRQKKKVCALLQ